MSVAYFDNPQQTTGLWLWIEFQGKNQVYKHLSLLFLSKDSPLHRLRYPGLPGLNVRKNQLLVGKKNHAPDKLMRR